MQMIKNEQAVTVTLEAILLFSITVMLLGMVMLSFQSINEQASETVMKEQYAGIGNDIASKILDMDLEIKASLSEGSEISIENELDLIPTVANKPYMVELEEGNVVVRSIGSPSVTVKVPFNPDVNVVSGSTIQSLASEHHLMYDPNGQIMFKDGGAAATVDDTWPIIYIQYPLDMAELDGTETIRVDTWDDIEVAKVEYYIDEDYATQVGSSPFSWVWDTTTISDGTYTITAFIYDRSGHYSYDTRTYVVDNGLDLIAPTGEIVSPENGSSTDFNPPTIEAIVSDNLGIDNDSIVIELDGVDVTENATITNTSILEYNIVYLPPAKLTEDTHTVYVYAEESYYGGVAPYTQNVTLNWNFTIEPINDATDPTISINFPLRDEDLVAGEKIRVSYTATDNTAADDSGIDYLLINISVNSTDYYEHEETISVYPVSVSYANGAWEFSELYQLDKEYDYNITVFDRDGNSKTDLKGTLSVLTGQASSLVISDYTDQDASESVVEFNIKSSGADVDIRGLYVTFSVGKLSEISFGGVVWANPNDLNPSADVLFGSLYRVPTTDTALTLTFTKDLNLVDDPLSITLYFDDGTSKDVEISLNP